MAKTLNSPDFLKPDLLNPMALWTDLGLRALEMTLSSSQNITEGVDRLTRAGASAEASQQASASSATRGNGSASAASSGLELAAQMQRTSFELMTQAWQQWMNAFATMASLGAGRSFGETVARQNPWLSAMREGLANVSTQAPPGSSSGEQGSRRRESHAEAKPTEHAVAKAEPQRRSRGGRVKPKTRSRRG